MNKPKIATWIHPEFGKFKGSLSELKETFPEQNLVRESLGDTLRGSDYTGSPVHHHKGWRVEKDIKDKVSLIKDKTGNYIAFLSSNITDDLITDVHGNQYPLLVKKEKKAIVKRCKSCGRIFNRPSTNFCNNQCCQKHKKKQDNLKRYTRVQQTNLANLTMALKETTITDLKLLDKIQDTVRNLKKELIK